MEDPDVPVSGAAGGKSAEAGPGAAPRPHAVLFACTFNAIRSPMAEGLMKHWVGRSIYVQSAGVEAGEVDPMVVEVLREIGVDLTRHAPKRFSELYDGNFDLVISMTEPARAMAEDWARTHHSQIEHWPMEDPSATEGKREQRLDAFRHLRDGLYARIKERFPL